MARDDRLAIRFGGFVRACAGLNYCLALAVIVCNFPGWMGEYVSKSGGAGLPGYLGLLGILAFFYLEVAANYAPGYYAGVDQHAYLMTAKSLATRGSFARHISDPYQFTSEDMIQVAPLMCYPKVSIGYPMICAAAYLAGGRDAVFLVNPILAAVALIGLFFLMRDMGGVIAGLCATLLLASNPLLLYHAQEPMSHAADICFAVWAMYFANRWGGTGAWQNALATGLLLGFNMVIRQTAILLPLPVALLLVFRWVRWPARRKGTLVSSAIFAAGAVVAALPMFIYQNSAFGAPWISGYSLTGESTAFGFSWFSAHIGAMLRDFNFPGFGLFVIFPVGVLGMIAGRWIKLRHSENTLSVSKGAITVQLPDWAFLALWALPSLLLYTAYYWYPQSNFLPLYLRFFLNIYPAIIGAAVLFASRVAGPSRKAMGLVAAAAILLALTNFSLPGVTKELDELGQKARFGQIVSDLVRNNLPAGAVVLADEASAFPVDYACDDIVYYPSMFDRQWLDAKLGDQTGAGPHVCDRRRAARMEELFGGRSQGQLDVLLRQRLLMHLSDGEHVALLCGTASLDDWKVRLGAAFSFHEIAESDRAGWSLFELGTATAIPANVKR